MREIILLCKCRKSLGKLRDIKHLFHPAELVILNVKYNSVDFPMVLKRVDEGHGDMKV